MRNAPFSRNTAPPLDKLLHWWRGRMAKNYLTGQGIVCDLGCGYEASLLKSIESKIKTGIGFDLAVGQEHSTRKIKLIPLDLNLSVPLGSNSVDIATSLAVIEHISDYKNYTREASRILKPGGLFIITTPAPAAKIVLEILGKLKLIEAAEIDDHKRYFNKESLLGALREAGFSIITFKRFQLGFNQLAVAKKR